MSRTNTVLAVLDTYLDLYSYVSKGRHKPQEVIQYLERKGRKSSSASNHVSTATDGKLPYISYSQEQLCLNTTGLAEELTQIILNPPKEDPVKMAYNKNVKFWLSYAARSLWKMFRAVWFHIS